MNTLNLQSGTTTANTNCSTPAKRSVSIRGGLAYPTIDTTFHWALDQLFDEHGFGTEYGPSTCESRSKWYDGAQTPPTCCWWNGNSWPYSTAHTLRSVAEHLRQYKHQNLKITVDNYVSLLRKYALTQYKNNKPYVAECHSPVHNFWVGDSRYDKVERNLLLRNIFQE